MDDQVLDLLDWKSQIKLWIDCSTSAAPSVENLSLLPVAALLDDPPEIRVDTSVMLSELEKFNWKKRIFIYSYLARVGRFSRVVLDNFNELCSNAPWDAKAILDRPEACDTQTNISIRPSDVCISERETLQKQIEIQSGFGLRTLAIERSLEDVVGAHALVACRSNELVAAAGLFRALIYCGGRKNIATRTLNNFFLNTQAEDGSFGHNDSVFERLRVSYENPEPMIVKVKSEISFHIAWALAIYESRKDPLLTAINVLKECS